MVEKEKHIEDMEEKTPKRIGTKKKKGLGLLEIKGCLLLLLAIFENLEFSLRGLPPISKGLRFSLQPHF